jgi:hypothetical protein
MDLRQQLSDIIQALNGRHARLEFKIKKHQQLHQAIKQNWRWADPPKNFIEECYVFLNDLDPYCVRGNRQKFEYFQSGFKSCKKLCECAKEKHAASMQANHGVSSPMQSQTIRNRAADTWFEKYGVRQLAEINTDARRSTCLAKWNAPSPLESPVIRNKINETNLKKLGVEYPFQSADIRQKIQEDWQKTNAQGQKTFVRNKQHGQAQRLAYADRNFSDTAGILQDPALLTDQLRLNSRTELALKLNCSTSLIDSRIAEFNLAEFQKSKSYYEILIANWLDQMNVQYEINNRKIIAPKELDFFIPSHQLAIEFCGLRWHGELIGRDNQYHRNKYQLCAQQGIKLIQIFQDEWDQKSHIVKDILKINLTGSDRRIHARQCAVQAIEPTVANAFLAQHHLQGVGNGAKVHLGLTVDDQLVAVMTFAIVKTQWELKRYAVKCGHKIMGGAGKLFKHFVRNYNPTEVFSYCDLRYFSGQVYQAMGFEYVKDTRPGYSYTKGVKRFNRLQFTKQRLVQQGHDPALSEWQIMQQLGYDRIWDCGHGKWLWINKTED